MPNILPISDLKNYSEVLSQCSQGEPVYLTRNGRGRYVVQDIADFEKQMATIRLLALLAEGEQSIREHGGLSLDEAFDGLET